VDLVDEPAQGLRLRPALMRFADPVRGLQDAAAALERLVARGEMLVGGEPEETPEDDDEELAP
jgi:chromosome partition protein MukE